MDRARQSLSSMASKILSSASPIHDDHSSFAGIMGKSPKSPERPSRPNPSSGGKVDDASPAPESSNPLFRGMDALARAAAPSSSSSGGFGLERAPASSGRSAVQDEELRRAVAPSTSGSPGPQRPPRPTSPSMQAPPGGFNPILAREMQGVRSSDPFALSPATRSAFAAQDDSARDPGMNKAGALMDERSGSMMHLTLQRAQSVYLVPGRFIKRTTWGSPRRKICTMICLFVFFVIFVYLAAQLVDVLKILNTSPSISEFRVSDMCSNNLQMTVQGSLVNPSSSGATINAMRSSLYLGNQSHQTNNASWLLGYIDTPAIVIGAGSSQLSVSITAFIPMTQNRVLQQALSRYYFGEDLPVSVTIPLAASFPASVFIIPITYSTTLTFHFVVPSYKNATNSSAPAVPRDPDAPETFREVSFLTPSNINNFVKTKIGLNMFQMKNVASRYLEITLPPIAFEIYINGALTVSAQTDFFHYGKHLPSYMNNVTDFGVLRATASLGVLSVPGVQYASTRIMDGPSLTLTLKATPITTSELTAYLTPQGQTCAMQNLLNGMIITDTFDMTPSTSPSTSSSSTSSPIAEVFRLAINDVTSTGVIDSRVTLDLDGATNLYGLSGAIPPVEIYIDIKAPNHTDRNVPVLYFTLPNGVTFYKNNSYVTNLPFTTLIMSATQAIRVMDQYTLKSEDVAIYIHTSATGSLFSRMLSSLVFDFMLSELTSSTAPTPAPTPSGRRRLISGPVGAAAVTGESREVFPRLLAAGENLWVNKSVGMDITSSYYSFTTNVTATGFDTEFFGGINMVWKKFDLKIYVNGSSGLLNYRIGNVFIGAYDTNTRNSKLVTSLTLGDFSEGAVLRGVIENVTAGIPVQMRGLAKYDNGPTFGNSFYFSRSADVANTSRNASISSSFVQLYHTELVSLIVNVFSLNVYFGLDFGSLAVDVTAPDVALAFSECGGPHFIAVLLPAWGFRTGLGDALAPVTLEFENAGLVINAITKFMSGEPQQICIAGHPSLSDNFLSYFLGALDLDFKLAGRSSDAAPVASDAAVMAVEVTSTASKACASIVYNLSADSTDASSFSLGWGNLTMNLGRSYLGSNADLLSFIAASGWYGPINPYRIARFNAPARISSTQFSLCALADPLRTLSVGTTSTKLALQKFIDGVGELIRVSGSLTSRLNQTNGVMSNVSGEFNLPSNTFQKFKSVGSKTSVAGPTLNVTKWFTLKELQILSFNGQMFTTQITFETGNVGFNVSLPPVDFRIGKLLTPGLLSSEIQLFNVNAYMPPFGFAEQYDVPFSLGIALIPPQDWGDTLQLVDDMMSGAVDVTIGASTSLSATFIGKILPTISMSLSSDDVTSSPVPGPDYMNVNITGTSSNTATSLLVDFKLIDRLEYKFIWSAIRVTLYNGNPATGSVIGAAYVPGCVLQEVNSGVTGINVTMYGNAALAFAFSLFNGSAVSVGFSGSSGQSTFTSYFKIPASVTESVALGSTGNQGGASSSLSILDVALLGANMAGVGGTMPCLMNSYCAGNVIRNDSQLTYAGLTGGITIGYVLPPSRIRWRVTLSNDISMNIAANGFDIATVTLRTPLSVYSSQTRFSLIFSLLPNAARIAEIRDTITLVTEGYDTVFTISGSTSQNYLSNLLAGLSQDVDLTDIPPPPANQPDTLGALGLSLITSIRTRLTIQASAVVNYNPATMVISVGTVNMIVLFGHTKGSNGVYNLNGYDVAVASTQGSLVLSPSPIARNLRLDAYLQHCCSVLSPWQNAVDRLVSNLIWGLETPMQFRITITPPAGNVYGYFAPFTLEMFMTIPASAAVSGFIDAINVNVGGTLTSTLGAGGITIQAEKVLKNTLSFPIIVSYFQYTIKLIDTDGVASDNCLGVAGLVKTINPCSILNLCYNPNTLPTAVGPLIQSGSYSTLYPGRSITDSPRIPPMAKGRTSLTIPSNTEMASRLVDEMMIKGVMCGDIADGIFVVGVQANNACSEPNTLEAGLTCTYVIRIRFELSNYALSAKDTCGSLTTLVPAYMGYQFFSTGLDQFTTPWGTSSVVFNQGSTPVTLLGGSAGTTNTISYRLASVKTRDMFQIKFDFRISSVSCSSFPPNVMGEGMALNFLPTQPNTPGDPGLPLNCGSFSCDDRYAVSTLGMRPFSSMVFAVYGCNSISWIKNGDIVTPFRSSQSCAGENTFDNGVWGTVTLTYDAYSKRAQIYYVPGPGYPNRAFDFDLDLYNQLGNVTDAYLAFTANTGMAACSKFEYRNFENLGPRTFGSKAVSEGSLTLVYTGEIGTVRFRARDMDGRNRGKGGNTWGVVITDVNGVAANEDLTLLPRVLDHNDGTYSVRYRIRTRGRYVVKVYCLVGSGANTCQNSGLANTATITSGLFVRSPP